MNQALHIFRKDIRFLRLGIAVVAALSVIHVLWLRWAADSNIRQPFLTQELLAIAAFYLIARVIQAEAIPGDRQFWVTRPYRWRSLFGAKLLFLAVCVNLPILVVRLVGLIVAGFPVSAILPGLLWSQFLLLAGVGVPIAAVASLTPGMPLFVFSIVIFLGAAGVILERAVYLGNEWMDSFFWIREVAALSFLCAIGIAVLYLQYKNRRTFAAAAFAAVTAVVGIAAYWYVPLSSGMALQAWLSPQPPEAGAVGITINRGSGKLVRYYSGNGAAVPLEFLAGTRGISDKRTRIDALKITFSGSNGKSWDSGWKPMEWPYGVTALPGKVLMMNSAFFAEEQEMPLTLRVSAYLTLLSAPKTIKVTIGQHPVDVIDGLLCNAEGNSVSFRGEPRNVFRCRTPFHWPSLFYFDRGSPDAAQVSYLFRNTLSYSPFPNSGIDLLSMEWRAETEFGLENVAISVQEPVAHFRRDLELTDVHLDDFAKTP